MSIRKLSVAEAQAMGVRGLALSGDVDAPAVEIAQKYTLQSYLDDTLGVAAILRQPPNEQIVPSTKKAYDLSGYALGLHPSSETPVAVQFRGGQQQGGSAVFRLKPGEVIRPFGAPGAPGKFSGFEMGLPFGWLGGGNATVVVFRTADSTVDWLDRSEVIYHRIRVPVLQPADVPAVPAYNWPTRFPWPFAVSGPNVLPQKGTPILAVNPTRTLLRLRVADLPAAANMRVYFVGTDALAEGPTGAIDITDVAAVDVVWGTWSSIASANFATQYQTQYWTGELARLGANGGGVFFVDDSGTAALDGLFVDVVRYGVL